MNGSGSVTAHPLVSVVIPVYKTEKYLEDCVQSVLKQSYENIQIILVDDGSPDMCPQLCDTLEQQFDSITVVHKENGGLSSARNAGLDAVSPETKFLLFLDSDDTLLPNAISDMVQLASKENADIVIPDRYIKKQEATGAEKLSLHFPQSYSYDDPLQFVVDVMMKNGRAWRAHSLLYKYNLIVDSKARFPIGHTAEDIVFNFQIFLFVKKIAYYTSPTVVYLKRAESITTTFRKGFEQTIWYIDKQAYEFLRLSGYMTDEGKEKADALLCRNIVLYLFSIMSSKNDMPLSDKKKLAKKILFAPEARNVWKKKHSIPYFESKKNQFALTVVYSLLHFGCVDLTLWILSIVTR